MEICIRLSDKNYIILQLSSFYSERKLYERFYLIIEWASKQKTSGINSKVSSIFKYRFITNICTWIRYTLLTEPLPSSALKPWFLRFKISFNLLVLCYTSLISGILSKLADRLVPVPPLSLALPFMKMVATCLSFSTVAYLSQK